MHPFLADSRRWRALLAATSGLIGGVLTLLTGALASVGWTDAALFGLPLGLAAAPLSLPAWYVCRATPLDTAPLSRVVTTGLSAAVAVAAIWTAVGLGWWWLLRQAGLVTAQPAPRVLGALVLGVGTFAYLLAVTMTYLIVTVEQSAEVRQRVLQSQVAQRDAELAALRAQIDPHFLFNSLNSVVGLMASDPDRARTMCQLLGDFLRDSLALGRVERIPVAREVGLATQYLRIEQVRFGSRLTMTTSVAPDAAELSVPPLILQPIVENAVRHGVGSRLEGGQIEITARVAGPRIVLAVSNPRDLDGSRPGTGLGLSIVRRRLRAGYGDAAALVLDPKDTTFTATITVPVEPLGGGAVTHD